MTEIIIFIFGAFIGSFLNVLIDRLPRGEPFLVSRSKCEHCHKTLAWYDLVPVVSYVMLNGKCRYCKSGIPLRLIIVEFLTAFIFLGLFIFFINSEGHALLYYVSYIAIVCCLIVIFFSDLSYGIIPDEMLVLLGIAVFAIHIISNINILNYLIVALITFSFFLLLFLLTKEKGMGFGDVKLSLVMGLMLGFPKILIALYASFLTGAFISVILILIGRKKFKGGTIAFGPFLVIGIVLSVLLEEKIIQLLSIM